MSATFQDFKFNNFGKENQSIDFDINQPALVNESEYVKVFLLKFIHYNAVAFAANPIDFASEDVQKLWEKTAMNKFARNFAIAENLSENFLDSNDVLAECFYRNRQTMSSEEAFRLIKTFVEYKNVWDLPCDLKIPKMKIENDEIVPVSKSELAFFEKNADTGLSLEYASALRSAEELHYWGRTGKRKSFSISSKVLSASFYDLADDHLKYERTKTKEWEIFKHWVKPGDFITNHKMILDFVYRVGKVNEEVKKSENVLTNTSIQFKLS